MRKGLYRGWYMAEPDLLITRHNDLDPYRLLIVQGETL